MRKRGEGVKRLVNGRAAYRVTRDIWCWQRKWNIHYLLNRQHERHNKRQVERGHELRPAETWE